MTPPWGINWQCYHKDMDDMPHIERMGYRSFTIYEWMWSDRGFCNELLSVARQDAIFLDRDHPLSEQKDDLWKSDPAQKGRNHADEWAQKVQEGKVFTPLDRTYFLGLNEPDSNVYQRQIDAYNEAYCRRMTQHGLRAAAYSFGVGHPSTVGLQPKTPPDWSWYAASAAAILEGHHLAAFHEYGAPSMGGYGWEFWCNRIAYCPYPFDAILDECGIDNGVTGGVLKGYAEFLTPEEYLAWLDGFQLGMAQRAPTRKVNFLGYNIFSFDHGRGDKKDWHSWDIRPLRAMLEAYKWSEVRPSVPVTPTSVVGSGPTIPTQQPHSVAYVVVPAGANVRNRPVDGDVLTAVPYGERVTVLGYDKASQWFRVQYGDVTGWTSAPLLGDKAPQAQPTHPPGDKWQRSLAFILRWEGGWADNPNDKGGATNKGITLGTYTRWRQAHGQPAPTKDDLRAIADTEVAQIYKTWYWQASGADALQWPDCLAVVDLAVNGGVGKAKEFAHEVGSDYVSLTARRLLWYTNLDDWHFWGNAWTRRCADLLKIAKENS